MIETPSPNHGPRPAGTAVDMVVLHYTGMASAAEALARLCDSAAAVSAHYLIDEDGTTHRLVDETRRAWHAGVASWQGAADINDRSIGIELVNPGHALGYRPFPEAQMRALEALLGDILRRHAIAPERVLGHSDVAPLRKDDPGELFDWPRLARAGLAVWPEAVPDVAPPDPAAARRLLARYGYATGETEEALAAALAAFQRHFRPARCDGRLDGETHARLAALCARFR